MTLLSLIITIALFGLIIWAITTLIPMPPQFKQAIIVIAVVCLVYYVLSAMGLVPALHAVKIGR